jgi:hypothetical protein
LRENKFWWKQPKIKKKKKTCTTNQIINTQYITNYKCKYMISTKMVLTH